MKKAILYEKLIEYAKNGNYGFHMPGHKRNEKLLAGLDPFEIDITEIDGFDNLHDSKGIIRDSMNNIASYIGTKNTWYLVNGSTCGILTAISAVTNIGDSIIIGRNCHKAVYNAAEIRNLRVNYLYPSYIEDMGIYGNYKPEELEELFRINNNIKAVVITSPTYEGVVSDIGEIAKITHANGAILIVDEAHGAHFFASEILPKPAYKLGADLVIESAHKTLSSLTQTAMLHYVGDNVDVPKIEKYLAIYQSSSPSYLMMASIEKAMCDAYQQGDEKIENLLTKLEKFRKNVNKLKNFFCIETVVKERQDIYALDPTKLIIGIKNNNINGNKLAKILRDKYKLELEMTSVNYVLAMTSMADDLSKIDDLEKALFEIDKIIECEFNVDKINMKNLRNIIKLSAYEASLKEKEINLLDEAVNKIAAEYIFLYPPGVPLLVPGEEISKDMIEEIKKYKKENLNICGLYGKTLNEIKVLK